MEGLGRIEGAAIPGRLFKLLCKWPPIVRYFQESCLSHELKDSRGSACECACLVHGQYHFEPSLDKLIVLSAKRRSFFCKHLAVPPVICDALRLSVMVKDDERAVGKAKRFELSKQSECSRGVSVGRHRRIIRGDAFGRGARASAAA